MTSQTLTIGTHTIAVEVLPVTSARDGSVPNITAAAEPIDSALWPMSPADMATAANDKLALSGGQPNRRDDCLWALKAVGVDAGFLFRAATTPAQRTREHAAAQRAALRGDLS